MKILALFLCLLLLVGVFSACTAAKPKEPAVDHRYKVGYAIRNINPWYQNNPDWGFYSGLFIMPGNDNTNPKYTANTLFDDNGDGVVDASDGLFTTATAITDSSNNTVLYVTIDSVRAYSVVTTAIRNAIVAALGSDVITADRIFLSANHTHSGAPFDTLKDGNEDQKAYYNWVIEQIKETALEAFADRAPAELSKGTVNATEATAALGYNGGKGYHMNAVRHYEVTDGDQKYIIGSAGVSNADMKVFTPVEVADNDMHVLLFQFPDDEAKRPIIFVNWRAHSTMNSGIVADALSSDYVNGIRTTLGNVKSDIAPDGYRTAFFQGASGDVTPSVRKEVFRSFPEQKDWVNEVDNENKKTFIYGKMLGQIAQYCVEKSGKLKACSAGKIRTVQVKWHGELQIDSAGLQMAAQQANNLQSVKYPYTYNGYTVNANLHRNAILNRRTASASYTDLELNAVLLGNDVAFVTAPSELANKYYDYSNGEKYSEDNNDWKNLVDEATYGTPFVLGYTNDHRGYIGKWLDYAANTSTYYEITGYAKNGDSVYGPGTYESYTSRFAQGQGEALVKQFGTMLNDLKTPGASES